MQNLPSEVRPIENPVTEVNEGIVESGDPEPRTQNLVSGSLERQLGSPEPSNMTEISMQQVH